ncbi:PDZ domain-containing protein [Humisphaera borealis]|uniref:PDZ domain-containing protein n=1 Tax=Humisphaera borealis TaxID=2807512 RepID=A0A7M2WU89_9BACT|nr:PDZ domain-containing protein [Humisphaera borealis]QOV88361.1 PDZ domain-containing protein [Humisphaera borealis]
MRSSALNAVLAAACLTGSALVSSAGAQSARDERPENPRPAPRVPDEQPRNPRMPQDGRPQGQGQGIDRPMRIELDLKAELEKAAYLGVSTSTASKALRHQVELPNGVGLVVDTVAPDSPAAAAGLKQHDLLHKLNDQLLVNPQQLAVLVRTQKAGDSIKLTVIRAGKPVELTAKLIERDLPPLDELRLGVEPRILEDRLMNWNQGGQPGQQPPFINVFPRPDGPRPDGQAMPFPLLNQSGTVAWDDGTVSMVIRMENGKQTLVAKDKEGKELFNGPIDTEEQRSKLPPEVRDRMKNVSLPGMMRGGFRRDGDRREGDRRPDGQRPEGDRRSDTPRPEGEKPQRPPEN